MKTLAEAGLSHSRRGIYENEEELQTSQRLFCLHYPLTLIQSRKHFRISPKTNDFTFLTQLHTCDTHRHTHTLKIIKLDLEM